MSELTPPTVVTPPTTGSSNESATGGTTGGRSNRKTGSKASTRIFKNRAFNGETPELDAVLGLASETLYKGVSFEIFQDKIKN